ncbi:MAG: hypothetical protein AAF467_08870 [Actinomycetota bacterium]
MTNHPPPQCTLSAAEMPDRLALIEQLCNRASAVDRITGGLVLRFQPISGIKEELEGFVAAEQQCCSFWRLEVVDDSGVDVGLRWTGPPETASFLARLAATIEDRISATARS